jgi:hypothetical protein
VTILGDNRNGKPIRVLVNDTIFLCPPDLERFNVGPTPTTMANSPTSFSRRPRQLPPNQDQRFTADVTDTSQLRASFDKIMKVFETADEEP